jgi:hypothetical protein
METFDVVPSRDNQVSVSPEACATLGVNPGDDFYFIIDSGRVFMLKAQSQADLSPQNETEGH